MTVVGVPLRPFASSEAPLKLALNRAYFDALELAGATALPIPIVREVDRIRFHYELLDALLLPGGVDVEPRRYGAVARDDCHLTLMPELDEVELTLTRWAIADGLPVLAICRGIQVLNVACGGTLWQDLQVEGVTRESHDREPRDLLAHGLDIEPDSLLARTVGRTHLEVNSLHHQAIRDVGPSLRAVACSTDGLIEGVELPGHRFVVGMQCHPEELVGKQPWAINMFTALVEAGSRYRAARAQDRTRPAPPAREPAGRRGST
ncbi:MAG TPA: gamma-glutamyl-gamma-aminobutyrate hydrolase family protein [Candidatus Sulfotelmatobacter sp.]|nr:gamma-glutamyl-gamma-aminobutyrate hydrolase family protein [Candidatus Sulfotelmatobacter sp.]